MAYTFDELKALIEKRGVHAEFGDAGEGWGIEQSPHELATFLVRMQELNVTSCLEIGTGYKGGLSRFLAADMGWQVTSVDVQDYGHKFEGVEYVVPTYDTMTEHWINTVDLVFIDGDHSYKSVKFDYEEYGIYATKVIAFHDIAGLRDCEGVKRFWCENAYSEHGSLKLAYHVTGDYVVSRQAGIGWIEL